MMKLTMGTLLAAKLTHHVNISSCWALAAFVPASPGSWFRQWSRHYCFGPIAAVIAHSGYRPDDDIVQVPNQRVTELLLPKVTHVTGDAATWSFYGKFLRCARSAFFLNLEGAEIAVPVSALVHTEN